MTKTAQSPPALSQAKAALAKATKALKKAKAAQTKAAQALTKAKAAKATQAKRVVAERQEDVAVANDRFVKQIIAQNTIQHYLPTLSKKIQDEKPTKKRHVNSTDVMHFFGDMPGDETICIEAKPQKRVNKNESNPRAHGTMDTDGTVVDTTTGHTFPSVNKWLKPYAKDSAWRKVFYKGLPLEVYRQILIQEGGDLFYPRFHEKNRKIIGHRDYLKEFIQSMGIQVCANRPARKEGEQPTPPESNILRSIFSAVWGK